jgi:hypothetical protein
MSLLWRAEMIMILVHEENDSQAITFVLQIQKLVLLFAGCQARDFRF